MLFSKLFNSIFLIILISSSLVACNGENNADITDNVDNVGNKSKPIESSNPETPAKITETKEEPNSTETNKATFPDQTNFSWQKLSGWHTQGTISRNSPIKVFFNRDIIGSELLGKDASRVIHISPAVKGTPIFETLSKITWLPEEPLKAGVEYKVSIKPKDLLDIPTNTAPFQFSFNVIPLEFEVKSLGLSSVPDTENDMLLTGQLLVSDKVNAESVKKVLKASLQGKSLPIEWTHSRNGRRHEFTVKNIKKETFDTDVKLIWNGKSININSNSSLEVAVPKLNDFKLMDLRIIEDAGSNPYIQAQFSDVINKQQNIKGLVELAKNKYKIRVNQNTINIYPNKNINGTFTVRFNQGIKSNTDKTLTKNIERKITFGETKPQIKFVGNGSILPENATLEIPFMAVGVNAVEVTALEVFPDNMGQFLQNNRLSGDLDTQRTGRFLWRKTIPLTPANPNKWNRYSFNVTDLMKKHHNGLLRLTLTIKKQHSAYSCSAKSKNKNTTKPSKPLRNMVDIGVYEPLKQDSLQNFEQQQSNYYDYDWDNRNNPCHNAYFSYYNRNKTTVNQNFIASNIGLIAKQDSKGALHIISTDLRTAEPLTGVDIEVRNFQGQKLGETQSDGSGFATIALDQTPFLVIAKKFKDTAYLKVNSRTALPVSQFDVGGKKTKGGLKGIIYGERGVWRPGDNIFLTFVIEDSNNSISAIPENHPVTMKLINPRGRVVATQTKTNSVGGFYAFKFKTKEQALTGNWIAKAFLGGSTFSKSLMIETVRPNRLKLELSFNGSTDSSIYSSDGKPTGTLFSQWLHGATASNLKADISVKFSKKKTLFSAFPDYSFDDPARTLKSDEKMLLEGRLNDEGRLNFNKSLKPKTFAPGMLRAQFTSRVFEQGGAFSISRSSFDYHPYQNYVGLKLPESKSSRSLLHTDKLHTINIASVSNKGDAVSLDKVRVSLYKINWRWWWDKPRESLAEFANGKHTDLLNNTIINTVDGKAQWQFKVKKSEWGRYLIRVCDLTGKHCAGKTTYIDWPDWSGRAQESGSTAASRLALFTDKKAYTVGETAAIQLPAIHSGSALLTIETGSQILEQRWLDLNNLTSSYSASNDTGTDKNQIEIPITADMSPNAYVHISVLQPHKNKHNDRPIRLYGIIALEVANPETYLSPKILVDEEWKPQSTQTIKVSEKNGKQMNYTLAVVDEGLLGLTAFKTPNLHKHFYSKEALGIKTWDLYDEVIGAYGGKLERMLALGGGDEAEIDNEDSKKRRFPPVVRFLGPFSLNAGDTAEHKIDLPPYLGAVRVMVVAGSKGEMSDSNDASKNSSAAYGKAQKSVFIRQPLMLQVSLPRTLGPDEEVAIPVTLFATDDSIKDVTVEVQTDDLINLVSDKTAVIDGSSTTKVHFDKTGEKIAFVKIKTAKKAGKTHLRFIASAMTKKGLQKSEADVYLTIDHANDTTSRSITKIIEPQSTWSSKANAFGLTGTNKAVLEVSSVPPLNLEKRLNYLIRYPHGCLEQTTSSVFPQLFLSNVISLDDKKQADTQNNIEQGILRLQRFQQSSGDFSYWPGGNYENAWASVYAGHFLIEAKKKGYLVPTELLNDWIDQQINKAQGFIAASYNNDSYTQAYRLYVLALAGSPQLGAMNRLREQANRTINSNSTNKRFNNKSRWMLASAYQTASQAEAAKSLIEGLLPEVSAVKSTGTTFRSTLGDLGLQLQSLVTLNKKQDANNLLEKIADEMAGDSYQNTQGIAWALLAVSKYLGGDTSQFTADFSETGLKYLSKIDSKKAVSSSTLANPDSEITLKNTSTIRLFATLVNTGVPDAGIEQSFTKGLNLDVEYAVRDEKNKEQWRSIVGNTILQGSDVKFTVTVRNDSKQHAKNIALTIPVAAGMEILSATEQTKKNQQYNYRDLRDDRIHYYFSLKRGKQKTFSLTANASYLGRYYLPAINVEAMYDGSLKARQKGSWINIVESDAVSIIDQEEVSIRWHKSYLYDSPDDSSRTKMYLIGGDKVKVLNKATTSDNSRWLFIRFKGQNSNSKTLEKWIKTETTE